MLQAYECVMNNGTPTEFGKMYEGVEAYSSGEHSLRQHGDLLQEAVFKMLLVVLQLIGVVEAYLQLHAIASQKHVIYKRVRI